MFTPSTYAGGGRRRRRHSWTRPPLQRCSIVFYALGRRVQHQSFSRARESTTLEIVFGLLRLFKSQLLRRPLGDDGRSAAAAAAPAARARVESERGPWYGVPACVRASSPSPSSVGHSRRRPPFPSSLRESRAPRRRRRRQCSFCWPASSSDGNGRRKDGANGGRTPKGAVRQSDRRERASSPSSPPT